jgi:amino acid transporter
MAEPSTPSPPVPATPVLRRAMGFRDLVMFLLVTGFSLRWIAQAAGAGPSSLIIWVGGALLFYVPLVCCVVELSSRYPDEGGVYVWSKRAFGGFAGFITGWTYWTSNLPYFPALLYFTASNALFLAGARGHRLADNTTYFIIASLIGLGLAVVPNIAGLQVGKWLHNAGAAGLWIPALILVVLGGISWVRFGSATPLTASSFVPSTHLKDIIFWSLIAFSLSGLESASMMGGEIQDARRSIPRAVVIAGVLIVALNIASTLAVMLATPATDVSVLNGVVDAVSRMAERLAIPGVTLIVAALIVLSGIGQSGAWFAAAGRLPFVAGIDRYLPPVFSRIHPKWGSPYVSLLVQTAFAVVFIVLSQMGTTVKGAYDVLVSMSVIGYFIPYLFMFAALIALQREPAGPDVVRAPGGAPVAVAMGVLGFLVTALGIVLSCVPTADEANKALAVGKIVGTTVVLLVVGTLIYLSARRAKPAADVVDRLGEVG